MQQWSLSDDPSSWVDTMLKQSWAQKPCVKAWVIDRAEKFGRPSAKSWSALSTEEARGEMESLFNLVPLAMSTFFDDGFWASCPELCEGVQQAILKLSSECGVLCSLEKFEKADNHGRLFQMNEEGVFVQQDDGNIQILGKEMDIVQRSRKDSEARIRCVCALTEELLAQAQSSRRRRVPAAAIERCRGQWNFVLDTCKPLRALLCGLTASIKTKVAVKASGDKRKRAAVMGAAAYEAAYGPSKSKAWRWKHWKYGQLVSLAKSCDRDLAELMRVVRKYNEACWLPRTSAPSADKIMWIFNDSAGRSTTDVNGVRAGAAWMWSPKLGFFPYFLEEWDLDRLDATIEAHL